MALSTTKQYFIMSHGGEGMSKYSKCLNIYGNDVVSNSRNVCLWSKESGARSQIWKLLLVSGYVDKYKITSVIDTQYALDFNISSSNYGNCDIYQHKGYDSDTSVKFIPVDINKNIYKIKLYDKKDNKDRFLTPKGTSDNSDVRWELELSGTTQYWQLVEVANQPDSGEISTTPAVTGYLKYKVGTKLYSYDTGKPPVKINLKRSNITLSTNTSEVKILGVNESYNQRNTTITPSLARQCYTCAIANMASFLTCVDVCPNWLSYNSNGFQGFNGVINASVATYDIVGLDQLEILKMVASLIDQKQLVLLRCTGYGDQHWVLVYGYNKKILTTTSISTPGEVYTAYSCFFIKDSIVPQNTTSLVGVDTNLANGMAISLRGSSMPQELNTEITDLRCVVLNY